MRIRRLAGVLTLAALSLVLGSLVEETDQTPRALVIEGPRETVLIKEPEAIPTESDSSNGPDAQPSLAPTGPLIWQTDPKSPDFGFDRFTPSNLNRGSGPSYAVVENGSLRLHAERFGDTDSVAERAIVDSRSGLGNWYYDKTDLFGLLNQPKRAFYQATYLLPQQINPKSNIFQTKQEWFHRLAPETGETDGTTRRLLMWVQVEWDDQAQAHRLVARTRLEPDGSWTPRGADLGVSGSVIQVGQQFTLGMDYRWDTEEGAIDLYLDGQLWASYRGPTMLPLFLNGRRTNNDNRPQQWTVNNYLTRGSGAHDPTATDVILISASIHDLDPARRVRRNLPRQG